MAWWSSTTALSLANTATSRSLSCHDPISDLEVRGIQEGELGDRELDEDELGRGFGGSGFFSFDAFSWFRSSSYIELQHQPSWEWP
jgi:hypothetical protein